VDTRRAGVSAARFRASKQISAIGLPQVELPGLLLDLFAQPVKRAGDGDVHERSRI
jgi:hypothetical protein